MSSTGNVRQRKNGIWEARWTEPSPAGRKRRSVYGKSEREARLKMNYERGDWANDPDPSGDGDDARWVYFIQSTIGGPVKIGTAADVKFRLKKLQACCPYPLQVLAVIPGGPSVERQLHDTFAPFRLHGEWFDSSRELMAYIARLSNGKKAKIDRSEPRLSYELSYTPQNTPENAQSKSA